MQFVNKPEAVRVVVSIVAYKSARLVTACLESLVPEIPSDGSVHVIVVDNDSRDGTAEAVEVLISSRGWQGWAELARAPSNGGFAFGNNIATRLAREKFPAYEYLLLLNPDTLARPGAIRSLRQFMDETPASGIAGGRCEEPDGKAQESCFRFPSLLTEFAGQLHLGLLDRLMGSRRLCMGLFDQPVEADWVVGALMMIRRGVFESIGLMDEGFFLYYEETDFSLRARRAGWQTWHVPASRAVHFAGQITGIRHDVPARRPQYWYESRRRFFVLNRGVPYAWLADTAALVGTGLYELRRAFERKPARDPEFWVKDLLQFGAWGRGGRGLAPRRTS
jgi:N-acetylglucosaminyl-diphospho-decaprenol L-rhamnosyltransferase